MLAALAGVDADAQLRKRALFLARHLVRETPKLRTAVVEAGLLTAAAGLLKSEDAEARELSLGLLQAVIKGDPTTTAVVNGLVLVPQLSHMAADIEKLSGDEREWADNELELCRSILSILAA